MLNWFADRRVRLVLALGAGPLAAAGFAPVSMPLCLLIGLYLLFLVAHNAKTPAESALSGWLWSVGYFATGLGWTFRSMNEFGQLPAVVAILGLVLLASFLALTIALACGLARRMPVGAVVRLAIVLPACWVLCEWVRGAALLGFGWLSVGYAFVDWTFAAWAPILGVYGVSWVAASLVGGVAALAYCHAGPWGKSFLALFLGALGVASVVLEDVRWSTPQRALDVRVVQPALPVVMRADAATEQKRVERVEAMSRRSSLGGSLDLIVWPESVYVWPIDRMRDTVLSGANVSAATGASVVMNAFAMPQPRVFHNAVWVSQDGRLPEPVYAKMHLVPFGEFVPFGFRWFVDLLGIPMADQTRGSIPARGVKIAEVQTALQVCYENMFGEELRQWWATGNPRMIVNTANLGWFAPFVADQFTQMSQMRARETARPYIQALNNSHSALIDAQGRVQRRAWSGAQSLDMTVAPCFGEPTPFVRYGNGLIVLLTTLSLLASVVFSRFKNKKANERVQ